MNSRSRFLKHIKHLRLAFPLKNSWANTERTVEFQGLLKTAQNSFENAVGRYFRESLSDCSTCHFVGMEVEGIFRRSPSSVLLRQAKEAYDRGMLSIIPARGCYS